ncbi:nucleoside diphosphate kinase regulator [Roseimaritima ulvae]|uniref:Regulator of nucleoside diphosphate kinase n=1 Tax=Roseimaritima ulvae TaxID=980254 RepID=A0A5B9QW12_9BACT|nr:nucleoside diphosphate kinase regulator [Roseimaritima ulvae]QEG41970.1 Regulator of nucleoside diphosphate kinase [Roseimaritima ulvae]
MARRKIILNQDDHERLQELLHSAFANAFGDKPYLRDLRGELDTARVVDVQDVPQDVVTMDSIVRLRDMQSHELETYTLVYPDEADIAAGKLSVLAPIGTAILGYQVGDVVRWKVPSGISRWRIEELVYQPERDCLTS